MISAQTPLQLRGEFSDFRVGLRTGALLGTTIRMITSAMVTPFKWMFTKTPALDGKVACEEAWDRQPPAQQDG